MSFSFSDIQNIAQKYPHIILKVVGVVTLELTSLCFPGGDSSHSCGLITHSCGQTSLSSPVDKSVKHCVLLFLAEVIGSQNH